MKRYVIVGNGIAATGCIDGIRSIDEKGEITVISKEPYPAYGRPLISYFMEDKVKLENISYRNAEYYEEKNCKVLYGCECTGIDTDAKTVKLNNGKAINYDELCIASGSSPFIPAYPGIEGVRNVYTFTTLDDAKMLKEAVTKDKNVLILGSGLIGLKCMEGLYNKAASITVSSRGDQIMSRILDKVTAKDIQKYLEDKGINFELKDTVDHFDGNIAVMTSGHEIQFDILVMSLGVKPNVSILNGAEEAIKVDESMRTEFKNVYAAGDCVQSEDITDGKTKVMAIIPNAYMGGECAGKNMAGGNAVFDNAMPMNSMSLLEKHIMTAGANREADGVEVLDLSGKRGTKRLYIKDDVIIGYTIVDDVESAGIYTKLIRDRAVLSKEQQESLKKSPTIDIYGNDTVKTILESAV